MLQVKLLLLFLCLRATPASSNSVCHDYKLRKPVKTIVEHRPDLKYPFGKVVRELV